MNKFRAASSPPVLLRLSQSLFERDDFIIWAESMSFRSFVAACVGGKASLAQDTIFESTVFTQTNMLFKLRSTAEFFRGMRNLWHVGDNVATRVVGACRISGLSSPSSQTNGSHRRCRFDIVFYPFHGVEETLTSRPKFQATHKASSATLQGSR